MSNDNPDPPPVSGRWKPGQSGNPKGRPKKKPFTEALERIFAKLSDEEHEQIAMPLVKKAASGDVSAAKELADRLDGKVPTSVGGSTTLGPVKLKVEWSE